MNDPTESAAPSPPSPAIEPMPLWWRGAIVLGVVALGLAALGLDTAGVIGPRLRAVFGVACFIGLIAACSANLRAVNWRTIFGGLALQVLLAVFVILTEPGQRFFSATGKTIQRFLDFTGAGATFVFGRLADGQAMEKVFGKDQGFVFAFQALPTIIFVSSFFTLLYYFGVLQFIVRVMARVMIYLLGTSGAETLSSVANVFMGQTEAPLIVKPYVPRMTQSELLALMVGGMATISGGVMAVYIKLGADPVAILATSVMAAPCGLYLSKLLLPETEQPETLGAARIVTEQQHTNAVDAVAGGASDGLSLALNVAAMLIAFLAFIALVNNLLGGMKPGLVSLGVAAESLAWWPDDFSLATIFSWVFAPLAYLMGADAADVPHLADLLGTKLVANEFVAYVDLTTPAADGGYKGIISHRGHVLATYMLTGFANLASIGIQLGGIGAMAPSRRADLARLGGRALLAGFLATIINASIAGMLI